MASFKFGDDKIKVIFVVGSKTLHPGVIRKGVDFNISSNLNLDQKCFEALDMNYKIGTLKQTYFKKHSSFFFDGLLLEDEATLVGLGIVEGDFIYVGDTASFEAPCAVNCKTRVAKEISVGLNVLIGEEELGFDVIYRKASFDNMRMNLDSSLTKICCKVSLRAMDSFFSMIDQNIGQALADPFFKSWKVKRKTKPDFSPILNNLVEERYEHSVEVLHDFNLVWDAYIRTLPTDEELFGKELCKNVFERLNLSLNVGNVDCDSSCDARIHSFLLDTFYIGPARNSTFSNYLAYPPTVQLRGRKINPQTTLGDLFYSYQQYSEKENLHLSNLSYDNTSFDLDCKVSEVLLDMGKPSAKKNFFYFPFDITKSEDPGVLMIWWSLLRVMEIFSHLRAKRNVRRKENLTSLSPLLPLLRILIMLLEHLMTWKRTKMRMLKVKILLEMKYMEQFLKMSTVN
eukprot:TRINITY_DN8811_c0_g1_i2.p1 TRINITY_DN8811_c0_g1~~TRINITY_DN8811_c0_g1_i2.p1  ORF type:complete len:456 (-),score=76.79 TRINITY_DN8811_c0_g1_i2:859-2226(-)